MENRRPIKIKIYARAVVAMMLITVWILMALTGLLLWLTTVADPFGTGGR